MISLIRCHVLLVIIALGLCLPGCGQKPLTRLRTIPGCPWSGPKQQVEIGQRTQGKNFYGDIWKLFWRDSSGREYDPEQVSQDVWSYLNKIGEAPRIEQARQAGTCARQMRIVSVNPVVVLLQPCQHKRFDSSLGMVAHGTKHPLELAYTPETEMYFDEPMEWLSPDLNVGPSPITFSPEGVATIPLKTGQLRLVHDGDWCKIIRE